MTRIGFVVHDRRPEAAALAADLERFLVDAGHHVRTAGAVAAGFDATFVDGIDFVVSLGGDGTMLRSVELVAGGGVPILGVNLGQLGYLTEVEPDAAVVAVQRVLDGDYTVHHRMLLDVSVVRSGATEADPALGVLALNEAVLERAGSGHTVRLDVRIDGSVFTPYEADALIVATPTGSTAYAFSARGPIIAPDHDALLITPVSPHMLFDRSLVLGPASVVELEVAGGRKATLTVDGRIHAGLFDGDVVRCTAAAQRAQLIQLGPRDFHRILKLKFGLRDR